jgi:hypothetical protein
MIMDRPLVRMVSTENECLKTVRFFEFKKEWVLAGRLVKVSEFILISSSLYVN